MSAHVVVIGGGIAGLAAVEELTRVEPAPRVTLLEGSGRLGGHIRTERDSGFIMEAGPDVLLAAKPAAVELANRVGLGSRLQGTSASARGSYLSTDRGLARLPEGMTGLVPSRMWPFVTTPLLSPLGKLRVGLDYFIPPRRDDADESIEAFVVRRLGREMYDRLAEPLLSGISAGDGARLSMATMFPQLRALERAHGSLVRGMLAADRVRSKKGPSTADTASPFVSFPQGLSELVEAIVRAIKARDHLGSLTALRTRAQASTVSRNAGTGSFTIGLANGGNLVADCVIVATPAYVASPLVRSMSGPLAELLDGIEYESTVTVSVAYPRSAVPRALDATGYIVPRVQQRPVLACTWTSTKFEGRAPEDHALFRLFLGGARRSRFENNTNRELSDIVGREMREVMGITATPTLCRINRFERAMPQYYVGHLARVARIEAAAARLPGLHLAGAAYGGVGIPDCVRSGQRAGAAALQALTTRTSFLEPSLT